MTLDQGNDRAILRDLAQRYLAVCREPVQDERRDLWRRHNSLQRTRPLIYVRAVAWHETPQCACLCADPLFRGIENTLRYNLFWSTLDDDSIFEPWVTVGAVHACGGWGVGAPRTHSSEPGGSFKVDYPLKTLDDVEKLRTPWHGIDEAATAATAARVEDVLGDLLPVNVDRGPAYRMWSGDIATDLGYLRGIEHFMMDMLDNPEWLHRLCKFMGDGILKTHDEAEAAGDWGLCCHQNQAMPYTVELPDPASNTNGISRKQLWGYMAAQELTAVSPAMHEEFVLQYQLPILEKFGLTAYGCCEDLTHKIDMLRKLPNLRRIAVSPFADARACAEQIGGDYVASYRPSPADMVSYGFDRERIAGILRRDFEAFRANGCHTDITLKDVETVQRDPDRIRHWVALTRELVEEIF
jgi:hypothetical protein